MEQLRFLTKTAGEVSAVSLIVIRIKSELMGRVPIDIKKRSQHTTAKDKSVHHRKTITMSRYTSRAVLLAAAMATASAFAPSGVTSRISSELHLENHIADM